MGRTAKHPQSLADLSAFDRATGDAVPPGTARMIGVLEVRQKTAKRPWQRNDRFFAVAAHAHTHQTLKKLADLRPHLLEEIESFFV